MFFLSGGEILHGTPQQQRTTSPRDKEVASLTNRSRCNDADKHIITPIHVDF